jgi:mitogen-activated protein kinase organizer 1
MRPCISNNDSHIIAGSEDGKLFIWDIVEGSIVKAIDAHDKVITCVKFHPTAQSMISTSFDGTAKLWM